jgi:hypothetical protein
MLRSFTTTTRTPPVGHPLTVVTLMAIAVAVLSGCGEAESTSARPAAPVEVRLADAGSPSGVYVIDGARSVPRGAIRFVLTNRGKTERGAEVVAVAGDHGVDEAFAALIKVREGAPIPSWLRWAGGLGVIRPGQRGSFTIELGPGRYYVIDRSFEGNRATLSKLVARAALDVAQQDRPAPLPAAAASLTATEYRFQARGLTAGRHTVRLENAGKQPHNFVLSPIRAGKTLEDVAKYVEHDSGPPPVDVERETISGVLEGGTRQDLPLDLEPGRYALLCFASDRAGGPPHVAKGMLNEVTVR